MLNASSFSFGNFLLDVFAIFVFVLWFWLLITVIGDLFRRHDISGLGKAIWVIVLIVIPYLAVFIYLISQSRGMAERNAQRAQQASDELRLCLRQGIQGIAREPSRVSNAWKVWSGSI